MQKKCDHKHPLKRDGLSQAQRVLPALDPAYAKIDDRSTSELLKFAYEYAKHIKYFDLTNQHQNDTTWESFWDSINHENIEELEASSSNEPHLALFLCFLKLFAFAQDQLNDLTAKHLDFYYKQVLQLKQNPEQADSVHLIFELAKNANQELIKAGTRFKAGKDNNGTTLEYVAVEDTLISDTQVALMRSLYRKENKFYFASVSNSHDGLGEEPIDAGRTWSAFGNKNLPLASVGFALAAPILELQEGKRTVNIDLNLFITQNVNLATQQLVDGIEIYASGPEEWLGPFTLSNTSFIKKNVDETNGYQLHLSFEVDKATESIIGFNEEVLSGSFNTNSPIVRVVLNENGCQTLLPILEQGKLTSIKIDVDVEDYNGLSLENDLGKVDASKPFMPFGPSPAKGANFYIGSKEVFTKKLSEFKLKPIWAKLPDSGFKKHYENYKTFKSGEVVLAPGFSVASNLDFKAKLQMLSAKDWGVSKTVDLFNSTNAAAKDINVDFNDSSNQQVKNKYRPSLLSLTAKPRYRASHLKFAKNGRLIPGFENRTRFKINKIKPVRTFLIRPLLLQPFTVNPKQKEGFIRLSLQKDFGHKTYPMTLAVAMTRNANNNSNDDVTLPNEPYTPTIESLSLDYKAETNVVNMKSNSATLNEFENREIQFFHLTPFGHSEEHSYLKTELPFQHDFHVNVLPQLSSEGTFYLGLNNLTPGQALNVLIQIDEGSASVEHPRQDITWSILAHNHWSALDKNSILADHTNQLLTSGIVKFLIPKIITDDNTRLDDGYFWLRAEVEQHIEAVGKFVGVHTQALEAVFQNNNNDLTHLVTALPAEKISKMVNRLPSIKKVNQPYASFDGYPEELDLDFYKRVSERLRHKDRAVSIWDYEHLVLQAFPNIYKVKCLNHTNAASEMSPGQVCVIPLSKIQNSNVPNFLTPNVSTNTLLEIQDYLKERTSMFTEIIVKNPEYETVELAMDVVFKQGLEFNFYEKKLQEDIKTFLSPWAFESGKDIQFGGRLHKSVLISYIDGLSYVDFIAKFQMFHTDHKGTRSEQKDLVQATNARAILTSANEHTINQTTIDAIC